MSIKTRILAPLAVTILVGVVGAGAIGAAALVSAESIMGVVGRSLAAIDGGGDMAQAFARGDALVTRWGESIKRPPTETASCPLWVQV